MSNFHCNNKGRHITDPGYKPVCEKQCADCAEDYPQNGVGPDKRLTAEQQAHIYACGVSLNRTSAAHEDLYRRDELYHLSYKHFMAGYQMGVTWGHSTDKQTKP